MDIYTQKISFDPSSRQNVIENNRLYICVIKPVTDLNVSSYTIEIIYSGKQFQKIFSIFDRPYIYISPQENYTITSVNIYITKKIGYTPPSWNFQISLYDIPPINYISSIKSQALVNEIEFTRASIPQKGKYTKTPFKKGTYNECGTDTDIAK